MEYCFVLLLYAQQFTRSSRARRRYWARSYAGWRKFNGSKPSPAHTALASLEKLNRLSFMITQNVDRSALSPKFTKQVDSKTI